MSAPMTALSDLQEVMRLVAVRDQAEAKYLAACVPIYGDESLALEEANNELLQAALNFLRTHAEAMAKEARDGKRLDWLESLKERTEPGPNNRGKPWPIASDVHLNSYGASIYVRVGGIAYGKGERDKGFHAPTLREAIDAAIGAGGEGPCI